MRKWKMSLNRKREKGKRRLIYLPRPEGQTSNRLIRMESLQLRNRASQDRAAEHKGCSFCRLFSGLILVFPLYFPFACLLKGVRPPANKVGFLLFLVWFIAFRALFFLWLAKREMEKRIIMNFFFDSEQYQFYLLSFCFSS